MGMDFKHLKDPSVVILFAYSPVGFGHLRVTDALFHGLPEGMSPLLLGSQDKSVSLFYRFVSIHPITRRIMEMLQSGWGEDVFVYFYKRFVQAHPTLLYRQLLTILDQQIEQPKIVLIVATHFGIAHQLEPITKRIEQERNIKIYLVVQVTDDSPQHIWYVPNADVIFVPSERTKEKLMEFAKEKHLPLTQIIVNPYPIAPSFTKHLSESDFARRKEQLDPSSQSITHIMVPISGAAVGTAWLESCMRLLYKHSSTRYRFHIVAKQARSTRKFLETFSMGNFSDLHTSANDREVVDLYEAAYAKELLSLEITKPSEQAFKAVLSPKQKGGVILLFTEFVGKQEQDNIAFLVREGLIPSFAKHKQLWEAAKSQQPCPTHLFEQVASWRGLVLPSRPNEAADFIHWCLKEKVFKEMLTYVNARSASHIVQPTGVTKFWEYVEQALIGWEAL